MTKTLTVFTVEKEQFDDLVIAYETTLFKRVSNLAKACETTGKVVREFLRGRIEQALTHVADGHGTRAENRATLTKRMKAEAETTLREVLYQAYRQGHIRSPVDVMREYWWIPASEVPRINAIAEARAKDAGQSGTKEITKMPDPDAYSILKDTRNLSLPRLTALVNHMIAHSGTMSLTDLNENHRMLKEYLSNMSVPQYAIAVGTGGQDPAFMLRRLRLAHRGENPAQYVKRAIARIKDLSTEVNATAPRMTPFESHVRDILAVLRRRSPVFKHTPSVPVVPIGTTSFFDFADIKPIKYDSIAELSRYLSTVHIDVFDSYLTSMSVVCPLAFQSTPFVQTETGIRHTLYNKILDDIASS